MSIPQPPSADQLAAARLALWRQNPVDGAESLVSPIETVEAARQFISTFGLVLFAPRPQHINSPAPSLVEATLAVANPAPTVAASAVARTLLARLIAEGSAVPLNLLGAASTTPDAPDFVASAAIFPYIFTLRGDKAWKQPPAASGATKVTPLALNTYTLLLENGASSATDLATALGKEITEAAVLRALNELWQHLRVLPVPNAAGGATLWETVAARFTKQLKAGANAGQPTALSALISLYLSQSLLATEADIETFLSPLAPRSRVRDVIHALAGARQLESLAVDGKTHLHIHGDLPSFATAGTSADLQQDEAEAEHGDPDARQAEVETASEAPGIELAEDGSRIRKFVPRPRKIGTGYVGRAKPFGSSSSSSARPARPGRSYEGLSSEGRSSEGRTSGGRPPSNRPTFDSPAFDRGGPPRDRPARPFSKPAGRFGGGQTAALPSFNKPWEEEKQQRQQRSDREAAEVPPIPTSGAPQFQDIDLDAASAPAVSPASFGNRAPTRPAGDKARFGGDRPAFSRKPAFGGDRPAFSRKPPLGGTSGDRSAYGGSRDAGGDARPPRRDFAPREGADSRPPRRDFAGGGKPSFGDRKPYSKPGFGARRFDGSPNTGADRPAGARPPFGDRRRFGDRPKFSDRPKFGDRSKSGDRPNFSDKERRPFRREDSSPGEGGPPRREFTPRGDAPGRPPRRDFAPRADAPGGRPSREGFDKPRTFRDREAGESQGGSARPERPAFRKFDAPRKPFAPREGGSGDSRPPRRDFAGSSRNSSGDRKPFTRPGPGGGSPSREGGFSGPPRESGAGYAGKREGSGGYAGKREGSGYAGKREGAGGYAGKREGSGYAGKKPFGAKPGGFAGKKPFSARPSGPRGADAPGASTFDKFKGGNKPWGKRPPGRKPRPEA